MRDSGLERYNHLAEVPTPSAYITLAWTNRSASSLPGLRAFKNLTELDLTGNHLLQAVMDLQHLRYMRKLTLCFNSLETVWPLPASLEHLNLAHNQLASLTQILSLQRLNTLDVSHNQIKSLDEVAGLPVLKCIYAAHNLVSDLDAVDRMPALMELDLGENRISSRTALMPLHASAISAVRLTGNPFLLQSTDDSEAFPRDFLHLEDGLFIRNPEKLKDLRSSRFHKLIKDRRKSASKVRSSPDWGHSKTSSRQSSEEVGEDQPKVLSDPISLESQRLSIITRKSDLSRGSMRLPLMELTAEAQDQSNIFAMKLEETFHQNEDESLHFVFQDLISHFQLDQTEEDFSFSAEKYERVASVIKQREDERLHLLQTCSDLQEKVSHLETALQNQERILMRLNDAESQLALKSFTQLSLSKLRKENATLTQRLEATGRIKDTLEGLQEANVKLRTLLEDERKRADSKMREATEMKKQLTSLQLESWEEINSLRADNEALRAELAEGSKELMVLDMQKKIRELEEQNEQLKSGKLSTSFDCSDIQDRSGLNVSAIDCSYYRKAEDGSVLINKRVGLYVEQLKNKVLRLQHKVKMLRDQRNKSNAQLQTWAKYFASLEGKM